MYLTRTPKLVFISGLAGTGASYLAGLISTAENASPMKGPQDGQFRQKVYCDESIFGGPIKFAFDERAHLTEDSSLVSSENRLQLLNEWEPHWSDKSAEYLIEKSNSNIVRTRFLQALFPEAYFVTIIRHPLASACIQKKEVKANLSACLQHWVKAYEIYMADRKHLNHELLLSYEQIVANPKAAYNAINDFLDIEVIELQELRSNKMWFSRWNRTKWWQSGPFDVRQRIIQKFENEVKPFGYSFKNLKAYPLPHQRLNRVL